MRHEDLYLYDIVEAADAIGRFIAGSSSSEFANDDLTSSAVLQKLSVIGEAAARLSEDFRAKKQTYRGERSSPSVISPFMLISQSTGKWCGAPQAKMRQR